MIEVVMLPPLASIQDAGRDGYWAHGLGRAGATNLRAHRLANLMLGNRDGAATLEIPLTPARFRFTLAGAFALAGAACGARLDGRPLPRCWAGVAPAGAKLTLGAAQEGGGVYLALPGGIDVPEVLGSRSTQLRESFGGLDGRVLAPGDSLAAIGDAPRLPAAGLSLALPAPERDAAGAVLVRALPSTELAEFSLSSRDAFWSTPYAVTAQSNRQGFRLEGAVLERETGGELRSHGIVPGIVQVPNGGQPIIQLADSATMGGYPKIAAVIEADLWRVASCRPGDRLRFIEVDLAGAAAAEAAEAALLARIAGQIAEIQTLEDRWS